VDGFAAEAERRADEGEEGCTDAAEKGDEEIADVDGGHVEGSGIESGSEAR